MYQRRDFLVKTATALSALALTQVPGISKGAAFCMGGSHAEPGLLLTDAAGLADMTAVLPARATIEETMAFVLKQLNVAPVTGTVDTLKCGNPSSVVTGIVSTMFPSIEIIEKARLLGANFIIAHEPSFYNHTDDKNWIPENSVLKKKLALLDTYKTGIWRLHDHWHRYIPDGISRGFLETMDWLPYNPEVKPVFTIPALSLTELTIMLKKKLGIAQMRVVGNPDQACGRIAMSLGAGGGQRQIALAETEKPDVLLVGESSEWETPEYFRDAYKMGGKTAYIILGHALSEEPGMKWFAQWLQPQTPAIKATHIASGEPFTWV